MALMASKLTPQRRNNLASLHPILLPTFDEWQRTMNSHVHYFDPDDQYLREEEEMEFTNYSYTRRQRGMNTNLYHFPESSEDDDDDDDDHDDETDLLMSIDEKYFKSTSYRILSPQRSSCSPPRRLSHASPSARREKPKVRRSSLESLRPSSRTNASPATPFPYEEERASPLYEEPPRKSLTGSSVPFRFYPQLSTCRIPRASIRIKPSKRGRPSFNNSSTSKIDRPYCGTGQPGGRNQGACMALNKSHSLDPTSALNQSHHHGPVTNNHRHLVRRPQAISHSSMLGNSRHGRAVAVDDCGTRSDRWRRAGGQNVAYELSQDLADKRLEMLERRYGGDKARRAATTIQRAYRNYAMHKKFRAITATAKAQEKRLSRRFTVDNPEWPEPNGHYFDAGERIRSEFDKLNRNLNATVYGDNRRPCRSLSMRDSCKSRTEGDVETSLVDNETSLYCHSPSNSSDQPSLNNTSAEVNSYASSRELKYFTSEDSGFGGHEPIINKTSHRTKRSHNSKKVPPEIPRRTSSIKSESSGSVESFSSTHRVHHCAPPSLTPPSSHSSHSSDIGSDRGALVRSADNGSLSSVQSSGSDSSQSDRGTPSTNQDEFTIPTSPVWKRKSQVSEVLRKRQYRVGLNLFNKKPEKGVNYLIDRGFLENSPQAVAKFLLTRKGLSKQMIGEYLGNLQNSLNMSVLECFATEIDLSGMQVDVALRKFQGHFRMPGEAQKIERLMQIFAQRYCQCNRDIVAKLRDPETIFVLAFAIIMLNTDLHTASLKPEKRMKIEDFIKNLRGVDDGEDIEREMLEGMYNRIKIQEFRPGHDHVTQVMKVQQTIVGKKPVLPLPHRRLVCYCRLYEIPDFNKKERSGLHQREVFLFNDLLVITKIFSKKKNSLTYTFRESFPLAGLAVATKEATHYPYLLEIRQRVDNKVLATLNARNEHDRTKFCEDLRESILEMDEMENLRIEGELERQKANLRASRPTSTAENRDSGVADLELLTPGDKSCTLKSDTALKRTALSNSLLDIHEAGL